MPQGPPDWIARATAIGSLVVSICTGAVGYFAYHEQWAALEENKRQFQIVQSEQVSVRLNPRINGPYRLTNVNFGNSRVVQVAWDLRPTNTGNQRLSIVEYEITSGSSPGSTYYSGIDGGLVPTAGQKATSLPLTLEPGESREFLVLVGVRVPLIVYNVLSGINDPKLRTTDHATIALEQNRG